MNSIFKQGLYGLKENQNLKIKIMKKILLFIFFSQLTISQNQWMSKSISEEPIFETKQLFFGERMPNIVVSTDGSIIASFGKTKFMVRRSEDGGNTWGPTIKVADGIHGGGLTVDEKSGDIIAPFSGVLGYTGLTEDILVSNNIFIITLDDNSEIYSDIKIPESYSASIKKGLPVEVKLSSYKDKVFSGEVDFVSSRINADTRSLLSRIKVNNSNQELISGSLLEVSIKFNLRNSLSVPDTSVMIEGDKSYVYKINGSNIADKTEVKTGLRSNRNIEIISGLNEGETVVAEGLKKVRPNGKIKPITK